MADIPQDQVEAVSRAIEEAKSYPGPMSDAKWSEIWQWYTNPENCRNAGGSWETIRSAKAAIRVLTPMIAEECAELAITTGAGSGVVNGAHVARRIAAALRSRFVRSVKGAVT